MKFWGHPVQYFDPWGPRPPYPCQSVHAQDALKPQSVTLAHAYWDKCDTDSFFCCLSPITQFSRFSFCPISSGAHPKYPPSALSFRNLPQIFIILPQNPQILTQLLPQLHGPALSRSQSNLLCFSDWVICNGFYKTIGLNYQLAFDCGYLFYFV